MTDRCFCTRPLCVSRSGRVQVFFFVLGFFMPGGVFSFVLWAKAHYASFSKVAAKHDKQERKAWFSCRCK